MIKRLLLIALASAMTLASAARTVRTINDGWLFTKEGAGETVNIPHCWNADDCCDGIPGYYRGECTYAKRIMINDGLDGKRVYVRFEGAGQVCELIVNGKSAGRHIGGYTAFIFDVTGLVREGGNDFLIKVDNSHNPDIPPLSADFTFFGGIYRDVELVITPEDHICNTYYASSGVFITTPSVGGTSTVRVRTMLSVTPGKYSVTQRVYDPDGTLVASDTRKVGKNDSVCVQEFPVSACRLWDVDSPALYRVVTTLCDARGNELDSVENPLGFRSFSFDADEGFTLNGRHVKLIGTNRHQDYKEMGNALTDAMHMRDIKLLKDMGGNFLRIAHYPQDPVVTQLCDRYGIVCSVEIPVNNRITESAGFRDNCVEMAREMVCQDFNSPSVMIWAYMNEVLLTPPYKDGPQFESYSSTVREFARAINDAIKELDGSRCTMLPCHNDSKRYIAAGLTQIPDILGWNLYEGWYTNSVSDIDGRVAKTRTRCPDKPFIITEYGAGVDPRIHSAQPERFDFSGEYGLIYHKHYLDVIRDTPFIAGANVWNLNDFYSEGRVDAVPDVNNKGLVGLDRVPKDSYLFYQANLLSTPFLAIGGRDWTLRAGNSGERQRIEVYSNRKEVTLYHNGVSLGTRAVVGGCVSFELALADGENVLVAEAPGGLRDAIRVQYAAVPEDMRMFTDMNVCLGGNISFTDDVQGVTWIPEQEYRPGSWGYVGGKVFRRRSTAGNGSYPGTNSDILGTGNDPLFQTQRVGIESFRADVPDGKYYVWLYFAELAVKADGKPLPYNLGADAAPLEETVRVFDVYVNGEPVLRDYDIRGEEGPCTASIKRFTVDVAGGKGLCIDFGRISGEPVLNAVSIHKCL